jgi:hypothetical protein
MRQTYCTLDRKIVYGCISLYAGALSCYLMGEDVPRVARLTNVIIYVKSFSMLELNSRNACYHSVQNLLPYSLLSKIYLLTYLILTPRSRFLPEKMISYQLVKIFPNFYGTRSSLLQSQAPFTCTYPELRQSSPCLSVPLSEDSF